MRTLRIDVETYSDVDLKKCGVYRYVESPEFEILLFAFAYDDETVRVVDFTAFEELPEQVMHDLTDPEVLKTAYNANFERVTIGKHFGIYCDPVQWRCTSVWALTLGLPGTLDQVAKVLKIEVQKDTRGKNLIKYFSVPCKPTKVNGERTRNHPHHDPEKWETYKEYNAQDVVVERVLAKKLSRFPVPDHEWAVWALDQHINDRGVRLEPVLFQQAISCDEQYKGLLLNEARELTGLSNPNSDDQLKKWLAENGLEIPDGLSKDYVPGLIEIAPTDEVRRVLELRQELGKKSTDKYRALERGMCTDGRIRGILQFCGANRTWRWAGRIFQPQNIPKNDLPDLDLARSTLIDGDFEFLETLFGPSPFTLSELIRTVLIPSEGCRFIVADFNAIEARVIAWLADEDWVLEVFKGHGKIYEATASRMFGVPLETIVKGHPNYKYRPPGKVAQLACGFGGGGAALERMDKKKEIDPNDYPRLVKQWREANPKIRKLWYRAEDAAMNAIREKRAVKLAHGVQYRFKAGMLFADLPSGHSLTYANARIDWDKKFEKDCIVFDGMDQQTKKWVSHRTWGGTLVENLVQAIARDCLAENMMRLDANDYSIVLHVHDEVVLDVPNGVGSVDEVCNIMGQPVTWALGLPLKAAGYETNYYKKDD